jgi:apolipoprotein N-acyltransferase
MSSLLEHTPLKAFIAVLASLASGALLALCFPAIDLGWLAWIALVPLFVGISGRSPGGGFLLSTICALVFFPGIGNWLFQIPGYSLLQHAIWGTYLSLYFGLFGLAFNFISKHRGILPSLIAAPFLWVALEYIRSHMGFMAFPWGLLSHSQYNYPRIIQIASLTGNYGVTFLVFVANAALAGLILLFFKPAFSAYRPRSVSIYIATAAVLITSALLYGHLTITRPIVGKEIKVSVVQGNIGQDKKWDPRHANTIMETYARLTWEASKDRPHLIVWPEAATPRAITLDRRLYGQVRDIVTTAGAYILLGSTHHDKLRTKEPGAGGLKYANSAFLISPDKKEESKRYDKIRLLPFGEYLPMKDIIPWSHIGIPDPGSYFFGQDFTVFDCQHSRFSSLICWETIFPDLARSFVRQGAQYLVNITNEAWFGKSAAPYQFLSMNVFRAVENRVYIIRCANTGVSCFIDPNGRIVDRVRDKTGQDIFVQGVLSKTISVRESKTIYTQYGDWFAWLCILSSLGFVLRAFLKKRNLSSHRNRAGSKRF